MLCQENEKKEDAFSQVSKLTDLKVDIIEKKIK